MALEIAEKFAEHVFIAGLVQIGTDDLLGISLCFSAADVHQFCRPKPEQLVAPSGHTEVLFVSVTVVFFVNLPFDLSYAMAPIVPSDRRGASQRDTEIALSRDNSREPTERALVI